MFSVTDRRRNNRHKEIAAQVLAIQQYLLDQFEPIFAKRHGQTLGPQLAHAVIDRLFARQVAPTGRERQSVDTLSATALRDNRALRNAVFASLQEMLEVETAKHNVIAKKRILDTLQWARQFGEHPTDGSLAEAFDQLMLVGVEGLGDDQQAQEVSEAQPRDCVIINEQEITGETWEITVDFETFENSDRRYGLIIIVGFLARLISLPVFSSVE